MLLPERSGLAMGNMWLCSLSLQLAGGIILGVALWLRHDSQTTNILYLQLGDKQAPNTFYVGE